MRAMVVLTPDAIPEALASLTEPWSAAPGTGDGSVGAWLDFYGIVRAEEPEAGGAAIRALEYEAHEEMAVHQMEKILADLASKYPLRAVLVVHRLGVVPVGEPSLLVRILSPHRGEALAAAASFIDELKKWVPIWKHAVLDSGA